MQCPSPYDTCAPAWRPAPLQRKALALLGMAGPAGMLQNEMADILGVESRNFFYVVKARPTPARWPLCA